MTKVSFTLTDPNTVLLFVDNLLEKSGEQKNAEISKEEVLKTFLSSRYGNIPLW